ncbi:hypothetical protein BBP40_006954 [Aspergillus hancockii]|nr:hypothetical protein BBP40_006954 [Aspergillus hancockii]
MLLPNSIAILGRAYPPGLRKEMIFSFFGATAPSGFIAAGVLLDLRTVGVLAVGVLGPGHGLLVLAVLGLLVIPHTPLARFTKDIPIWAALVGWPTPYNYALLLVCFLFFGVFVWIERNALCPLLPQSALTGDLAGVLGCIAAGWSSFDIIIYYFYQVMEVIKGDSLLFVTAKWVAAASSGAIGALLTGFLLGRPPPSVIMFCAMAFFTAGLSIFATVPVNQTCTGPGVRGQSDHIMLWGMDMSFPSDTLILSNSVPHHHQGLAASLVTTTVNYSISLGLGFAGTVVSNVDDGGRNAVAGIRMPCIWALALRAWV